MHVTLLAYTPDPIRVLWTAARTCYSVDTPQELWRSYEKDCTDPTTPTMVAPKVIKLLRSLWKRGHHSVFEHISLTYAVAGVSRVLLAQYSRHRIGVSLSVQSQRHVRFGGQVVRPPSIDKDFYARQAWAGYLGTCMAAYEELLGHGVPKEDARFVLPEGAATNFVTTVNLRSLMYLYQVRVLESGAQWEIKELVREMVRLAVEAVPELKEILCLKAGNWEVVLEREEARSGGRA